MRSEDLLRGMHKVCSHDLPNQLVALQALLQMLREEEFTRLSLDGQEYVQRLQKVAQRTSAMARFLKEMGKLNRYAGQLDAIALSLVAREIQGAVKQLFPQVRFTFDWQWSLPTVRGDYRTFLQALTEILSCLIEVEAGEGRLQGSSEKDGNRVAVHFWLTMVAASSAEPAAPASQTALGALQQRMEIILARARLDISSASMAITAHAGGASRFTIRADKG